LVFDVVEFKDTRWIAPKNTTIVDVFGRSWVVDFFAIHAAIPWRNKVAYYLSLWQKIGLV
jgi:hypothetical protein